MMSSDLERLIDDAKQHEMTLAEQEAQRRSFAYGNVNLHDCAITREMIDEAADYMKRTLNKAGTKLGG